MQALQADQASHQQAQAAAVDELDAAQMKNDVRALRNQIVDAFLQGRRLGALDNPPAAGQDGDLARAVAVNRERHAASWRPWIRHPI